MAEALPAGDIRDETMPLAAAPAPALERRNRRRRTQRLCCRWWLSGHHRRRAARRRAEQRHLRGDVGAQRHEVGSLGPLGRSALRLLEAILGTFAGSDDVANLLVDGRSVLAQDWVGRDV